MKLPGFILTFFCFLFVWNPTNAQEKAGSKVVVISLDGAADYILDDLLKRKVLTENSVFGRMAKNGIQAKALIPVNIAATAVSHAALYTGASPAYNGIVGNQFLMAGDTIESITARSGFAAPIVAETLWSAALRQGKSVININTVGVDGRDSRKGSKTIGYGKRLANSVVQTLVSAEDEEKMAYRGKFENILKLSAKDSLSYQLQNGIKIPVFAMAIDEVFDGEKRYTGILVDLDKDLENGYAGILRENEWTELTFKVAEKKVSS